METGVSVLQYSLADDISLSHIGWAVASLEKAMDELALLGFNADDAICVDRDRQVRLVILKDNHSNTIELVAPDSDKSPVSNILKRIGAIPYHICFAVNEENWENVLRTLTKKGFLMLHEPAPAPLFHGKNVAFFYSKHLGLLEFVINNKDVI